MSESEKTYHESKSVTVTNTRAIFLEKTYAMSNITSVVMGEIPANRTHGALLAVVGLLVVVAGFSSEMILIIPGLALLALGVFWAYKVKPTYTVRIGSASGETEALRSKNLGFIESIVDAMNQAIIERG